MISKVSTAGLLCAAVLLIHSGGETQAQEGEEYEYFDYVEQPKNCSVSESIAGGWVSYSLGGAAGSVLTYHCNEGSYPFPVSERECAEDGEWSTMRLANGRMASQATCKEVQCPAQLQLDNGQFWPRKEWFRPGETQEFLCNNGYNLYGSALRNCTALGQWTGILPICDDRTDDCANPGTPPGALSFGHRFRVGEIVRYRCQAGLDLLGSAERICLDSLEWSGSETRCMAPFAFDSPESVAQAMSGSFSGIVTDSPKVKKTVSYGRTIRVAEDSLNIYILLDTSGSITKENFEHARNAAIRLIQKLDSYEVEMRFHVVSFASEAKDIISITIPYAISADQVVERLNEFDHKAHGKKTGTNLYAALYNVYEKMAILKKNRPKFNETQNIILIITDGHINTGKSPEEVLRKIRILLGINKYSVDHSAENFLDIYVFGVGGKVNKKQLNNIASNKRKEKHLFFLNDNEDLKMAFDKMISDSGVTMCGVAHENRSNKEDYTRPWHVNIMNCKGSILTENWILTAAHCFTQKHVDHPESVDVVHGNGTTKAASVILHQQYNVRGLRHKGVKEFYDYDVALVKVAQRIKLSEKARPICLPCTKPSSRALKMSPNVTCEEHEKALLTLEEIPAFFLAKKEKRKQAIIHFGSKRPDCIKHAAVTFSPNNTASLEDIVTDRFLCTGGSKQYEDSITCKGDSGGSLFLRKRQRYFQVAVVSWGTKNICNVGDSGDSPPDNARDFHISIFSVVPWLQEHLGPELEFLPTSK
ncbi:complement factor B [Paramormyrops kingsleyae]|uniref:complement factor B n=1 Tax=Paramormyrops kingsleyae TaxID=1676925 RepID=UPI003B96C50A